MRTFPFPGKNEREQRLMFFGAEASSPEPEMPNLDLDTKTKDPETPKVDDKDGTEWYAEKTQKEASEFSAEVTQETDALGNVVNENVDVEITEGDDDTIAEAEAELVDATSPDKVWADGKKTGSAEDDRREDGGPAPDPDAKQPEGNDANPENETPAEPDKDMEKAERIRSAKEKTDKALAELTAAEQKFDSSSDRTLQDLDNAMVVATAAEDAVNEELAVRQQQGDKDPEQIQYLQKMQDHIAAFKADITDEVFTAAAREFGDDAAPGETNPPEPRPSEGKPAGGEPGTADGKPAEGKSAEGKPAEGEAKPNDKSAEGSKGPEKDETNAQRIERETKEAKDVLKDPKATAEQKIDAAFNLFSLTLERAFRQSDGTLASKSGEEEPTTNSSTESGNNKPKDGKEAPKEKKGNPTENASEKKDSATEFTSTREARLMKEVADNPDENADVPALLKEKQKKLDEKVNETRDEIDTVDGEIDGFDTFIDDAEDKQRDLKADIRDWKQELKEKDMKGETGEKTDKERKDLKKKIQEAEEKIADLDTDIAGMKEKKGRRETKRDKLESERDKDADMQNLRDDIQALKAMKEAHEKDVKALSENLGLAQKELAKYFKDFRIEGIKIEEDYKTLKPKITVSPEVTEKLKEMVGKEAGKLDTIIDENNVVTNVVEFVKLIKMIPIEKKDAKK